MSPMLIGKCPKAFESEILNTHVMSKPVFDVLQQEEHTFDIEENYARNNM